MPNSLSFFRAIPKESHREDDHAQQARRYGAGLEPHAEDAEKDRNSGGQTTMGKKMKYPLGFQFFMAVAEKVENLEVRVLTQHDPPVYWCRSRAWPKDQRRFNVPEEKIDAAIAAWNRRDHSTLEPANLWETDE